MSKRFIQIIIQEKGKNDFRGFCICSYNKERWELRGRAAENPSGAAGFAIAAFNSDYEDWPNYGYQTNDHLRYPNIDIRDIAEAVGVELTHMFGSEEGRQIKLKLEDGRTLTLTNSELANDYSVTCK